MTTTNPRFEALSKICLNNWHYISQKVLPLNQGINFFTGHSGSGKSTVIDAMQIVLYANTDGRGFFNKAATDDSDRNLIEYLRGMVNIGDDNNFTYLRNNNFSSTIVLEFQDTEQENYQCVGVVFDVETATNEITKMFFWHKGELPADHYRTINRAKSTEEVKTWLTKNFQKEDYYFGSHNERFRKQLYDIYLGGLDGEKFPRLFKRAIPFRMNIKLEEFVKEYICMEQDIHIEDMQQSVMEYGRLRKKIEETCREIEKLGAICEQNDIVTQEKSTIKKLQYFCDKLDILKERQILQAVRDKEKAYQEQLVSIMQDIKNRGGYIQENREKSDELLRQIASTDYEQLRQQLEALKEIIVSYDRSRTKWQQTAEKLTAWEDVEVVSNQSLWDIEAFQSGEIEEEAILRLKKNLAETKEEVEKEHKEYSSQLREMKRNRSSMEEELAQLKMGEKAYPKELEELRRTLQLRLSEENGKEVAVEILADLLDIRDEEWRDAVEGYLGSQKLGLMVEPKFAKRAMEIYQEQDKNKYFRYGVIDTERVSNDKHQVLENALAEEVITNKPYVRAYIDFLLGKVIKCHTTEELRECRIGITSNCVLYHSYRIQHMNPSYYTRFAYIGKSSLQQRIRLLQGEIRTLKAKQEPIKQEMESLGRILELEALSLDTEEYIRWQQEMHSLKGKLKEQERLEKRLESENHQDIKRLEEERKALLELIKGEEATQREQEKAQTKLQDSIEEQQRKMVELNESLVEKEGRFHAIASFETEFDEFMNQKAGVSYEQIKHKCEQQLENSNAKYDDERNKLIGIRSDYLRTYPNRNFSPTDEDNREYQELYDSLNCDSLEEFRKRAAQQAKTAVIHFKDDFMYKIRSAIKEAQQKKDELNRIISKLDFGKDKYQFYIGKNKGPDGEYYDMFMDDSLEINPSDLDIGLDNQLNMFTMEHENHYSAMINDLISIFIPPDNATVEEMEAAKRNMDKYADYRTYLTFDMQQLIQNEEETIKIRLSKMITKNSGGEGQNPLYVALLASFAQAYKIDLRPGIQRNPTIRLVVLDEAFSKMDAEKVASCIKLMRGLGFQAIISATNDKIQNYLETVDKVFVFANPNKKAISIQEFERKEFEQLKSDIVEEE
ncbi:MAG: AAA family ATPase [Lachnospiraceae bacterium]|nr:AAA family ATPase [Lachnospiraceae bacterium]